MCIFTGDKCALKPSGISKSCFIRCQDALRFMKDHGLVYIDADASPIVIKYLETVYDDVKEWRTSERDEECKNLSHVIKFLKDRY